MPSTDKKRICVKCCLLPQRYLLALMVHLAIVNSYTIRLSLGVVLKYLIKGKTGPKVNATTDNRCNFTMTKKEEFKLAESVNWASNAKSNIKLAFFLGYLIGHVPSGYMADRYGGKHVLGMSILLPALLNLITPIVIRQNDSPTVMMVMRFVVGLLQAGTFPASHSMISNWTPQSERGGIAGIIFSATQIGTIVHNYYTVEMIKFDWPYVFYIYGGSAIMWWLLFMVLCYSNPKINPFIGQKEERYLRRKLKGHVVFQDKEFPWKKMLCSVPVWALAVAQCGHLWVWHSLITDLPNFMTQILKFDISSNHLVTTIPYGILGCITLSLGFASDQMIKKGYVNLTTLRKIFTTLGAMGPGIFIVAASLCDCNRSAAVYLFCLALGLMGCYHAGARLVTLDLAPNYSGCVMGLANGLGALPSLVQPYFSKKVNTSQTTLNEWRKWFLISLCVLMATNIFFVIFGTARELSWNYGGKKGRNGRTRSKTQRTYNGGSFS